jgi:predicted amidohydrolase YtcJ
MKVSATNLMILGLLQVCSYFSPNARAATPHADSIYIGGDIVTMDDKHPFAQAVAVKDGKILAVGERALVLQHMGAETKQIDLKGRTMIPGLIDAHGHVFNVGAQASFANLSPAPDGPANDIPTLQTTLRQWASQNPQLTSKLGWILGMGYDEAQLKEKRAPVKEELDAISTELPIIVIHQSGHLGVLNSRALALAGITAASVNPPGGVIRRVADSTEPDGVVEEAAFFAVIFKLMGALSLDDNKTLFQAGVDLYTRNGYTTAQEGRATKQPLAVMAAVAKEGKLPIDVVAYADIATAAEALSGPLHTKTYQQRFRIGGAKLNLDGSPQGKTAWLTKPYFVAPHGQPASYTGYGSMSDEQANSYVDLAFQNGWQLLTHVNGDAAIDQLIRAVSLAEKKHGKADRRPVAIHAQTARLDQIESFKALDIFPSFFPLHTFYWGDWHRDSVLGPERANNISPTGWVLRRGMKFTSHHDAPVTLPNPMRVLSATVNRSTRTHRVLGLQHRVTPLFGLKAQTIWAATQHFEEATKGSIEVGKLADFTILERNPLKGDPDTIATIKVDETIKEGRSVYVRIPTPKLNVPKVADACIDSALCSRAVAHMLAESGVTVACQQVH